MLIPLHTGSIADQIDLEQSQINAEYWEIEAEANRFASELLMPVKWVESIIRDRASPPEMAKVISRNCNVSYQAAIIRLTAMLPRGYIYVATDDQGNVMFSGRSPGTLATTSYRSDVIQDPKALFSWATERWSTATGNLTYQWWHSKADAPLPEVIGRADWRAMLNDMVRRLGLSEAEAM